MIKFVGDEFEASIDNIRLYSDNTPMVKTEQFEDIVEKADTVLVKASNLNEFVTAMFLVDSITLMVDSVTLKRGHIKNLVLPYIPGARQDRSNPTGDVLFTLWSIAEMINLRFENVVALDPHSDKSFDLIEGLVEFPIENLAARVWPGYGGIIAPDKGAVSRAQRFDVNNNGVTYGTKVRDVSTGRLSGFDIDVEEGKHYLIVDDICDGGGTFLGLNEKIKEQGAYAHLYVSHGIFSRGVQSLVDEFGTVYTTDSHDFHREGVHGNLIVLPVLDDMVNFARNL